jgi:hypothetical protein
MVYAVAAPQSALHCSGQTLAGDICRFLLLLLPLPLLLLLHCSRLLLLPLAAQT